jgi:hypothetical protein
MNPVFAQTWDKRVAEMRCNCFKLSDLFRPFLNNITSVAFLAFKGPITLLMHPPFPF